MNLSKQVEIQRVKNTEAAGSTDITDASSVDMQNFEGCLFLFEFGAIVAGAVTGIRAQQSSDDGVADAFTDLLGTAVVVADTDDDKIAFLDIYRPRERYLKPIVDRATQNATLEGITAILYGPRKLPVVQGSTVSGGETHVSLAEGTA